MYNIFIRGGYRPCESCDFKKSNCLIYIKLGKYGKKIGGNREKSELHIVNIGTPSPL